ncbi:MAG: beta-glucuronidase [bacterium]|nr:beta-glucuronidase [bacterium]
MRRTFITLSVALFVLGTASLALTVYLWIGDWPSEVKEIIDFERSVAATEHAPVTPLVGNIPGRRTTSLDGTWQALIDPNKSILGRLFGVIARNARPESSSELLEFSFDNGLTLEVPGDWNTQDERLYFYRGMLWYKRVFEYSFDSNERVFLHFGAANYEASVYLNGERIGRHVGGHTPFNFEVTGRVREGGNLLVVSVDNEHAARDIPTPMTDWMNYGGLTRSVKLVHVPKTYLRDYHVQLEKADTGRIRGWVVLDGPMLEQQVTLSIPELGLVEKLETDASGRAEFDLAANPQLWSPEAPKLYRVEFTCETDAISDEIGFRTIEVSGTEILLNGESIFLRGISLHEEAGLGRGRVNRTEHADWLLARARELNANFLRYAHYPYSETMVRAADREGFLVWAEIPVYWNVDFANPYTGELGRRQLAEMINRDRNRASVIFWSIANETPISPERNAFMQNMVDTVRDLDPTRLISAAILTNPAMIGRVLAEGVLPVAMGLDSLSPDEWVMQIDDDPIAEIVDVPALNQYVGWYYSTPLAALTPVSAFTARKTVIENMHRVQFRTRFEKPLIISELGAGAKKGFRAGEEELAVFSEEYQALVYRKQLEMLSGQQQIRGLSPWILKDFRSPMRLYQGVQDYWNLKGLISDQGEKKLAFAVLQDYYGELSTR